MHSVAEDHVTARRGARARRTALRSIPLMVATFIPIAMWAFSALMFLENMASAVPAVIVIFLCCLMSQVSSQLFFPPIAVWTIATEYRLHFVS